MEETRTQIKIKEGQWRPSEKAGEASVQGRFLLINELRAAKSKEQGKPVYEPVVVCQIKVLQPANGDIICHQIIEGAAKSEALKQRFKTAYEEFEKQLAQHARETAKAVNFIAQPVFKRLAQYACETAKGKKKEAQV
jgi:hypothetical protein